MFLTYLCFRPASLSAAATAGLIEGADLGFSPTVLSIDAATPQRQAVSSRSLAQLRELSEFSSFELAGDDGSLALAGLAGWPTQLVVVNSARRPEESVIESAAAIPGFVAAFVGDADDVFWQSADQINTYEVFDRARDGLVLIDDPVFGGKKVDISANPGRQSPAPGMWLWAASKMWLGPQALDLLGRERVLGLPVGDVDERSNGIVVVELFDLADPADLIRERQRAFRSWLYFDELESSAGTLGWVVSDPAYRSESGAFVHGGSQLLTGWFADGVPAPEQVATEKRLIELNEKRQIVWQGTEPTAAPDDQ